MNRRSIDEQISGICSGRSNQSCLYHFRLLDGAEFIRLGVGISTGRFLESGLRRWLPTRRWPFVQLLEAVGSSDYNGSLRAEVLRERSRRSAGRIRDPLLASFPFDGFGDSICLKGAEGTVPTL